MASVEVPHLRWPFRLTHGRDLPGQVPHAPLQLVEQDSLADVRQCVHLLLRTPPGARPLAPDVGIEEQTFGSGVDAGLLGAQLEAFEDRARVTVTTTGPGLTGHETVQVLVELAADAEEAE